MKQIEISTQYQQVPKQQPDNKLTANQEIPINRKKLPLLPIISLFIILLGLLAITAMIQKPQDTRSRATITGPTLALSPATKSAAIGETFSLGITMNTDTDTVSAVELHLSYDPTAIQVLSFTPGTQLPVVLSPETHTGGAINVTLGAQPSSPFKGAGIVGTWTIKILAAKQSSLSFAGSTQVAAIGKNTNALVSSTGSTITGTSTVGGTPTPTGAPTATPTPTRTPTPTPARAAGTPTPTPTPARSTTFGNISQPTPTPPKSFQQPDQNTPTTTPVITPAPITPAVSAPRQEPNQTFIERIINSIVSFFKNLFGK